MVVEESGRGDFVARPRLVVKFSWSIRSVSPVAGRIIGADGLTGTYEHSYSWFEVSLLRDGQEVPGSRTSIQNNVHGEQSACTARLTISRAIPQSPS